MQRASRSDRQDPKQGSGLRLLRRASSVLVAVLAWVLLLWSTAAPSEHRKFKWRYWMDFLAGTRLYLDYRIGDSPQGEGDHSAWDWVKPAVEKKAYNIGIQPWQWWRLIGIKPFWDIRERLPTVPTTEDPGRAELLALGFRLVRGVSPYLLLWLGAFAALPVFLWTTWEFFDAGWVVAGSTFILTVATLPFVVDCLALPYSAVGFYVLALLSLVPFATYAALGCPTARGAAIRVVIGSLLFAGAARCRSDTIALLPGWLLAIGLVSHRVVQRRRSGPALPRERTRIVAVTMFGVAVFLLLPMWSRPPQGHNTWFTMWEGLGDFDRTKGHTWSDEAARLVLKGAGIPMEGLFVPPEGELFLRRLVLGEIRSDPLWYASILTQRLVATTAHRKPGSWAPLSQMSEYFDRVSGVDVIGFRTWQWQLPRGALQLPTLVLLFWWASAVRRGIGAEMGDVAFVAACPAAAALTVPVLVSIMGGQETEAFSLVHYLAFAFLLELGLRALRARGKPNAPADARSS